MTTRPGAGALSQQGHRIIPRAPDEPEGKAPYYYAQQAAGAVFGRRMGWEQPVHYGDAVAEHHIVRNICGLIDSNSQTEIYVEGPEALEAMQRLWTADMDVPIGRGVFACLCDEDGGVRDDGIIWRTGEEQWLQVSTTAGRHRMVPWVKDHIREWGLAAVSTDMTDAMAYMEIQGPKSREVVETLTDADVSNEALPFLWCTEAKIAGVQGLLGRAGFTGELGYEFYVPSQYGEWVWNKTVEAMEPFGGKPCGIDALVSCALEKGLTVVGLDYNAETSPLEAGVAFTVDLNKPHDFNGKDALIALKENGLRRRVLGFHVSDNETIAERGAPIHIDGKEVGKVRMGRPALTLGMSIGRCEVPPDTKIGTTITIMNESGPIEATTHSRYYYDPKHERVRG